MSLTAVGRRVSSLIAALFASACCTSLPRIAGKQSQEAPRPLAAHQATTTSVVWRDARRDRDVPVKIYAPVRQVRSPVVLFSHGIGEDRDSYEYIGNALAASGFFAVHMTHAGTDRAVLERGYRHLYRAVKQKENWINRVLDVTFVLDRLAGNSRADLDRVAVAGHSAGAFTAFGGVNSYFLTVFGKPAGASACECERSGDASLAQSLHLLNSADIHGKMSTGIAKTLAADARGDVEKIDELYLRAFSRPASETEKKVAVAHIAKADAKAKQGAWEDVVWALINTKEFLFNH